MRFFYFFKKKRQEEVIIKTSFKDIKREIINKKQKIKDSQKKPKHQIKESLSELLQSLEQGSEVLENLKLDKKKAPERAKLIVKENLIKFNEYLVNLISNLKEINSESLETLISKINLTFQDFEKKSIKSFQKSTFLVGKELGDVRDHIKKFYRGFNKIIKESEPILGQERKILVIEEKLQRFNEIYKNEVKNNEGIKEIEKIIEISERKIQDLKKEIKKKKEGPEYIERRNSLQEIERLKINLVIRLQELKDLINFKALTKVYHSIESKMELIKNYKERFKETLEKEGFERLQELVSIKEINLEVIDQKIKEIKEIKQSMDNLQIGEDVTEEIVNKIKVTEREIDNLNFEKAGKQRRDNRLIEDKTKLKQEIIEEVLKIGIVVEDI